MLACFKGTIARKINVLQQKLQTTDIVSQPDNQQQVQKLNNLESQAWLYQGILERLGEAPTVNHEKIARTLEALEYKRSEILQEIEPRRPRKYQVFANIQESARFLLDSQAEKDYKQLDKIVTNLVIFARSRQPSPIIIREVIERIAVEIAQNSNQISPYRLRLAYKIDDLIKTLSEKLVLGIDSSRTDGNAQTLVDELNSRINLLSEQFNSLLRRRHDNTRELNRRVQNISELNRKISDLYRTIVERDETIAALRENADNLTKISQRKQAQIDRLQNSIADLQKDIESSKEIDHRKQAKINDLQNQLTQLNQQKSELQQRIQNIDDYAQTKNVEAKNLENENFRLNAKKSEIERQYQQLHQRYQQQQNEIANLKLQLLQANRSQDSITIDRTTEQPIKETREKISKEEYKKINNQGDYYYVDNYSRKDGTPVKGHYKRRPNR